MKWLAWRQFRAPALIIGALLAAIAVVYAITGPGLAHFYDTVVKPCKALHDCNTAIESFQAKDQLIQDIGRVVVFFPVLLGMFWGAPLVARELETGTFRLSWTQSVTRGRWFVTRVGLIVLTSIVASALLSLMVTWWSRPYDKLTNYPFQNFDIRDVASIGYTAFAVMLGIALGAVLRRTIPAMGATLFVFAALRVFVAKWVRVRFEPPLQHATNLQAIGTSGGFNVTVGGDLKPGDWVVSNSIVDKFRSQVSLDNLTGFQHFANGKVELSGVGMCPNAFPAVVAHGNGPPSHAQSAAMVKCIASFHLRDIVSYQPVGRYWTFQWYEMALFLVLAAALGLFSYWWVQRRVP